MISVDEALALVFKLAAPVGTETLPLRQAAGRVLAAPVIARRSQPPFRASIMDGYAVAGDADAYTVIGEAPAGQGFETPLNAGEAIRIFTGAPVPDTATRVIIQEDVTRSGDRITIADNADSADYIRPAGRDFTTGDEIPAGQRLTPARIALAAAMNVPEVSVSKQTVVAIISTGDELVMPGEDPGPSQIVASNGLGLAAMLEAEGCDVRLLPIAKDTHASLTAALSLAADADLVVTIGGASVGDYDLVGDVAADLGMDRAFYKIAMRPGKPLMAGRLNGTPMLGLPGNPVSSIVCGHIFLRPLVRAMQGLPQGALPRKTGTLAHDIGPNGPREHYMRAQQTPKGLDVATSQDSALLSVLSGADALVIRQPHDPARDAGSQVSFIEI